MRFAAIIGAATVSALAVAPAFGAAATSQSSAQSIDLTLAGHTLIAQKSTAANDGTTEKRSDNDTIPNLVGALPDNTLLKAAVLPQLARAKADGTSFACAGLASDGDGGPGVVTVGNESCDLKGSGAIPLSLGHLALGDVVVNSGALGDALAPLLNQLGGPLNQVVTQISAALNGTPLGQIGLTGNLGVISAVCSANPDAATGDATLADSAIRLSLPGQEPITLVNLPVHPNENQKVVGDTKGATTMITDALSTYLSTIIQKQFAGTPLATLPSTVQAQILNQVLDGLKPLTDAVAQYLAEITLRETTHGDNGRSIDVTALHAEVLPALKQQAGFDLVEGRIGRVTCGPNTRATAETPATPTQHVKTPTKLPHVPTVVDSGLAGHEDHTARNVLGATGALLLIAGTAGLVGYRRMLGK
ncbi:hypothetical protein EFL26_11500 [Nocardioides pocheonensis]|uniref:Choice-of-anchor G family protein n=1 Tax=Nocardioides pocheonensis TaxID=661485 RepID=A0A3N0GNE2_9ACTN|nr:hypothetical protein EFL26_11500 [Nocardioides pocheonensis]